MDSFCPSDKNEWRKWLEENHIESDSIWLIVHKKNSSTPNITWSEAVDEALCFGWIDSVKKTVDSVRYKQYFSKRKPDSNWSKINKDKVEYLIDQGLMTEQGYKSIEVAKTNGSWNLLDEVEALIIPHDLQQAFESRKGSGEYFESLSNSNKKVLLAWIVLAKRAETRQKRIIEVAENASKNLKPKQFR